MSPYPGGKHGPGHYIPGSGAVAAAVEVGVKVVTPAVNTVLPASSTEAAGDRIFAGAWGSGAVIIVDGTWTQLALAPTSMDIWTKVAAGDATDVASISGFVGNETTVGVKWTMKDIAGPGSWDFNAQSTLRNTPRLIFDCNSLAVFGIPKPSISFFAGHRIASGINGAAGPGLFSDAGFNGPPNGGVIMAQKLTKLTPATSTGWSACNWNFQAVKTAYPTGESWAGCDAGVSHLTQTRGFRYDHD